MKGLILLIFCLLPTSLIFGQSPLGIWQTIDDETGEAKSHIEIYDKDGLLYGKIIKLLTASEDKVCDKCPGDRHLEPLMGMILLKDLRPINNFWKKGKILDPESGNVYGCSIWFDDGKTNELRVRGKHWTGIYRTQTWFRVKDKF